MGPEGVALELPPPQKRRPRPKMKKRTENDFFPAVDYYFNDKHIT